MLCRSAQQNRTPDGPTGIDPVDGQETWRPAPVIKKGQARYNHQTQDNKWIPNQTPHYLRSLRDEKDFVVGRKLLFGKRRTSVGFFDYGVPPFRDFPRKHPNEVAVQLNGVDHIKGQDYHANRG